VVVRSTGGDNAYHNRDAVSPKSKGASKDANAIKADKDEQFQYQQERLQWRKEHQHGGDDNAPREDSPKVNFPKLPTFGASAENRAGPGNVDRSDHPPPKDDLASASNPIGNVIRKLTGGEPTKD
jgi:hypothetical protein